MALIALFLFFLLIFVSRLLSRALSQILFDLSRSEHVAIHIVALLFFPGVVLHELSHFFMASILFVPTGEIEFVPTIQGNSVKLGSVAIAKTDLLRRFLIGVAPIIGGIAVMLGIFWFFSPIPLAFHWKTLLFLFLLFEIGNTMFASKKDLEGAIGLGVGVALFVAFALFMKLPLFALLSQFASNPSLAPLFIELSIFLGTILCLDVLLIVSIRIAALRLVKRRY